MPNTYINLDGFQRGIAADETGINIAAFSARYFPQYKDFRVNKDGQNLGFAEPDSLSCEVTLSGDVIGDTGVMAADFATAYAFGNATDEIGAGDGGLYWDEITISQSSGGWKTFTGKATSHPLIS